MQNISLLLCLFLTNALCLYLTIADNSNFFLNFNLGNDSADSAYISNLEKLFSSLSTEAVAKQGFYGNNVGIAPDKISGFVLCRGDVNSSECSDCLNQSFGTIKNHSYPTEAVIWYDHCLLDYSNKTELVSSIENYPQFLMWNQNNFTNQTFSGWETAVMSSINITLYELLTNVSAHAAFSSATRFGTGMTEQKTLTAPNSGGVNITYSLPAIYGLSQCTPNFSSDTCRACLQDLIDELIDKYDGRQGGRNVGVKCNLRYETYSFFFGTPDILLGSTSSTKILPPTPSGQPPSQSPLTTSPLPSPPLTQSGQPPLSSAPSNPPHSKSKGEKSTA